MQASWRLAAMAAVLALAIGITNCGGNDADEPTAPQAAGRLEADRANGHHRGNEPRTLYVWTSDEDGTAPEVLDVKNNRLEVSPNFQVVDFNTAFATGRARPHGVGMK